MKKNSSSPSASQHQLSLTTAQRRAILRTQQTEITEFYIYQSLASATKEMANRRILQRIANEEKKHAEFWASYTKHPLQANQWRIGYYRLVAKLLGFTFVVKLMENAEETAQVNYQTLAKSIPAALAIEKEETAHEKQLIALLDEERLRYVGSMVLGLNDALVELTGALAGLTLALQNHTLVAISGLITGIAASLSMAASEYLSVKTGSEKKDPLKSAVYTGGMYIVTVCILIAPYFLAANIFVSLAWALINAVLIILFFTYYVSVAQEVPFKRHFLEMAGISLGVSALTFLIGLLVRNVLGVEV